MSGARKLIEHLDKNKIPKAICTGSSLFEFDLKTKKCQDLVNKFKTIVLTGDDDEVKHGKPAPDPFLVTMKRMHPVPTNSKNVLVFEDSLNGVISALKANNSVIWIPQVDFKPHNWSQLENEFKPKVAEILDSFNDFHPEKYGLPTY